MKVKQLIIELEGLDPELEVYFDTESDYSYDILEWISEENIDIEDGTQIKVALIKNKWPD